MIKNYITANKVLTYSFAVFLFCIGFDKIIQTNLITNWQQIVGPVVHFLLPVNLGLVVMIEGMIEIFSGILLLTHWKKYSLLLLVSTITIVVIDLFMLRDYNLAIHEIMFVVVCVAIYVLDSSEPDKSCEVISHEMGR